MTTATKLPSVSLYYKEGTSDKEYHISILGDDQKGYQVEYRYGKRGQTLKAAFKNKAPITLDAAKALYDSMEAKQRREGYTTAPDGTPHVGTENQGRVSGLLPQLLNPIEESEVEKYIKDNEWVMQEKKNGHRQMIRKSGKDIEGVNRKGLTVSLPETVVNDVREICGQVGAVLDGELIGEVFWIFDMLTIGVHALTERTYQDRLVCITEWLSPDGVLNEPHFKMVPTAIGTTNKRDLFERLKREKAEGVVFTKLNSVYKVGRPNSKGDRVKFKFMASATVRCKCLNDQNSFVMEMLSKGDWVEVGNCTFFPTKTVPKPGKLYEVEYMYAYPNGSLYGPPVLLEERTDVDEDACVKSQLKYKQGTEEES